MSERPSRGRPTIRTPEAEAAILRAAKHGFGQATQAALAGIGVSSLKDWKQDDPAFSARIRQAKAEAGIGWVNSLIVTAEKNPAAAIFLLKSRFAEFRDRKEVSVTSTSETARALREAAAQMADSVAPPDDHTTPHEPT